MDLEPRNDKYIIYAMLKKDFEFVNPFDKLEKSLFAGEDVTEFFGINKYSNNEKIRGGFLVNENCKLNKRIRLILGLNEEVDWKCIEYYKQKGVLRVVDSSAGTEATFGEIENILKGDDVNN